MPVTAKGLTEAQGQLLGRVANSVWDDIGGDCLRALEECGEKPLIPRSHVIELVVDADRLTSELERMRVLGEMPLPEVAPLLRFMRDAPYTEIAKALKLAFPHSRYGW
jgi:hypothetical protein